MERPTHDHKTGLGPRYDAPFKFLTGDERTDANRPPMPGEHAEIAEIFGLDYPTWLRVARAAGLDAWQVVMIRNRACSGRLLARELAALETVPPDGV
jgi:hypothetical protein